MHNVIWSTHTPNECKFLDLARAPSNARPPLCIRLITEPDSVIVHVIRGENSAAMQHESAAGTPWSNRQALSVLPCVVVSVIYFLGLVMSIDGGR